MYDIISLMKDLFKFIIVYIIIVSAVIFSYLNVYQEKKQKLLFTKNELHGITYLNDIYHLSINTALYQGALIFEDDKNVVRFSKQKMQQYIQLVKKYQKSFKKFKNDEFNAKMDKLQSLNVSNQSDFYDFLDYINHENYRIGDVSKLLFEEDRKAHFLSSLITHYMPEYLISILNSYNVVEELVRKNHISNEKKDVFTEQSKLIYLSSQEIKGIVDLLKEYDDTYELSLLIDEVLSELKKLPNNLALIMEREKLSTQYINVSHKILNLSYTLNNLNIQILKDLLKKRQIMLENLIYQYNVITIFILLLITIIMYLFYRSNNENILNLKQLKIEKEKSIKALEFKSQFLSNMSHEIRTPLNSIISLINLTIKTKLDEKQIYMLSKANSASVILLGVINDILDMSKIESEKMSVEKEPFNLKECVDNIYDMLLIKAQENGISLDIEYKSVSNFYLIGSTLRISQILTNLLSNAIKFTHHGGVSLIVEKLDSNIYRFEIKDTGIGLKEEQITTLFDEFTQADMGTSRKYGGTGLGLSISKKLTELMGGRIWVKSVYGKGSSFFFEVPLDNDLDHKEDESLRETNLEDIISSINSKKDIKILVAEDNKMNQMVLEMLLEDSNIELDFANDGKIALDKFKNSTYNMILMDIQMPNMNGYEATRAIRDIDENVKIIGLSANAMQEDIDKAKQSGMDDYLTKPIDLAKLYVSLSKYL